MKNWLKLYKAIWQQAFEDDCNNMIQEIITGKIKTLFPEVPPTLKIDYNTIYKLYYYVNDRNKLEEFQTELDSIKNTLKVKVKKEVLKKIRKEILDWNRNK